MGWTTSQRSTVDHKGVWYVSCLQYKHICILCIRIYILYIGFSKSTVKRILNEYEKLGDGKEFESPAKRYKVSRTKIHVDDFDQCAIRHTIHQMHSEKKYVTVENLLAELHREKLFTVNIL